jgi:hypothetical protein
MSEVGTQQEQLMVRFQFPSPRASVSSLVPSMYEYGGGEATPSRSAPQEQPWQPQDIERALATIRAVFRLGEQMAEADREGEDGILFTEGVLIAPGEELPRERKPLEVVRLTIGSLDVVLAVSGFLASGQSASLRLRAARGGVHHPASDQKAARR